MKINRVAMFVAGGGCRRKRRHFTKSVQIENNSSYYPKMKNWRQAPILHFSSGGQDLRIFHSY